MASRPWSQVFQHSKNYHSRLRLFLNEPAYTLGINNTAFLYSHTSGYPCAVGDFICCLIGVPKKEWTWLWVRVTSPLPPSRWRLEICFPVLWQINTEIFKLLTNAHRDFAGRTKVNILLYDNEKKKVKTCLSSTPWSCLSGERNDNLMLRHICTRKSVSLPPLLSSPVRATLGSFHSLSFYHSNNIW
jgi:hypothetical protein